MTLFCLFRTIEDLQHNGNYQEKLNSSLRQNVIDDDVIEIAENIQLLHNSMASTLPKDHSSQLLQDMIDNVFLPSHTCGNILENEPNIINGSI